MASVRETQRLRDNALLYAALMLMLVMPVILILSQLPQMELGSEAWIGLAFSLGVLVLALIMISRVKSEVILKDNGLRYRDNFFFQRYKQIAHSEVSSWRITRNRYLSESFQSGVYAGKVLAVHPRKKVLSLKLHDGREFHFGINRPVLVRKFLNDHWPQKLNVYG